MKSTIRISIPRLSAGILYKELKEPPFHNTYNISVETEILCENI